jgi:CO/xanthine dehydrogenase FAD-binding subunit
VVRFYKGGTRQALDISSISIALVARRGDDGLLRDVRLALGAVAPTPIRARAAEAALEGRRLDAATIAAAAEAAAAEAKPIDDVRASAWYRRELLRNMTARMLTDVAQS